MERKKINCWGKDVKIGWIYESSRREFIRPKEEKSYTGSEHREYYIKILPKGHGFQYDIYEYQKEKQWYKDFLNSSSKEILYVYGSAEIENRASEVVQFEPGQEIVTSLFNKIEIIILIYLNKELTNSTKTINELRKFIECKLDGNEDAFKFLPESLKGDVMTSNIYNGSKKVEIKSIIHTLNESCRILKDTPFEKANSACVIDGKSQHKRLVAQLSLNNSQNNEANSTQPKLDSAILQNSTKINGASVNDKYEMPPAVKYSQMTRSETNQMTEAMTSEAEAINTDKINTDEKSYSPDELQRKNKNTETIINIQDTPNRENKITLIIESNTTKRKLSLNNEIILQQLSNANEPYSGSGEKGNIITSIKIDHIGVDSYESQNIRLENNTPNKINEIRVGQENVDTPSTGSKNAIDNMAKSKILLNPNNSDYLNKLFGGGNCNSSSNEPKANHTFGYSTDLDKLFKTLVKENSNIKRENSFSSKETVEAIASSVLSNESKHTHDSNKICTSSDAHQRQTHQDSTQSHDNYSNDYSSLNNPQFENNKNSNTIIQSEKLLKDNPSTNNNPALSKEKAPKEDVSQNNSTLNISSPHPPSKTSNSFRILEPKLKNLNICGIEKQCYGEFLPDSEEKVILLLGASGCGKTTLVNFVSNYFEGVKTPDGGMVLASPILANVKQSHTEKITAYSFCSENEPGINFTFIDTPGLNDSSGAEVRDHVQSLKTFLANMNANKMQIHALGFVAQAHIVRLTSSERLVMDYVSTLFGEKVKDNIITFVTFADNQENPPVVEAVQSHGLKTKYFLKFNNSILCSNTYQVEDLDRVYWRRGYKNLKKCLKIIKDMPPLCMNAMKALQKEVYSKTVVEEAVKDFEAEMIGFAFSVQKEKSREYIKNASASVWDFATAAYYQIKKSNNSYASVEDLVTRVTIEVCEKKSINSHDCLKYLTLAPNRGMRPALFAIIYSHSMTYNVLMTNNSDVKLNKKGKKGVANGVTLFCLNCNKEHVMDRIIKQGWIPFSSNNIDKEVTLKCKVCNCPGDLHGVKPDSNEQEVLSINKILHHTRKGLRNVIQRYSIPGVPITDNELLKFLLEERDDQYNPFIKGLLTMKNIV